MDEDGVCREVRYPGVIQSVPAGFCIVKVLCDDGWVRTVTPSQCEVAGGKDEPDEPDAEALAYRARLILTTRRALRRWSDACEIHADYVTAIYPDADCIAFSARRVDHLCRRYRRLEAILADETGLPTFSVYNDLAGFAPIFSRLMYAGF
jgi:hypothetical protein